MNISEPTIDMLATAAGLAAVVWLVMQLLRPVVPADAYDRWGALLAAVVGVIFALAYTVTSLPVDGRALLQAVLVGLFGGWLSQNVNSMVTRAIKPKK